MDTRHVETNVAKMAVMQAPPLNLFCKGAYHIFLGIARTLLAYGSTKKRVRATRPVGRSGDAGHRRASPPGAAAPSNGGSGELFGTGKLVEPLHIRMAYESVKGKMRKG